MAEESAMNPVELGPADDGRQIPITLGDTVVVRLPESGAPGSAWDVAVSGSGRLTDDRMERPPGPVAGAALVRRITLVAEAPGQFALRAVRHNPWDDTVDEYRVEFEVG
jgi:predicted secreted protein